MVEEQIKAYIASQAEPKRSEMEDLHQLALQISPASKLWFTDGKNSDGKIVANPNIGYGVYTINYADGTNREFYKIGLSANTTGISVYILGLKDKKYLAEIYGEKLGKGKRDRVLYQVQNAERYKLGCTRNGTKRWI